MTLKQSINKILSKNPYKSDKLSDTKSYFGYFISDVLDWKIEKPVNEYGLEMDYIRKCIDELFSWKTSDWWFLYVRDNWEDNWSRRFDLVEKSSLYEKNITHRERVLYYDKGFTNTIWPYFIKEKIQNIIELGPWSWEKFPEYWHKWIKDNNQSRSIKVPSFKKEEKSYYAMDISPQSINNTKENYESRWITLSNWVTWDFFNGWELPRNIDNQWYVFLWWSIGNFDKKKIIELLKRMAPNSRLHSVPALVTYFSAPDKLNLNAEEYQNKILELKAAYWDPDTNNPYYSVETHHAINDFIMWGFKALWIPTENLELVVEYQESVSPWFPASIKVWAKILQSFDIREWYRTYTGHKWHNLRAIQSQRFSEQDWQIILKDSDFRLKKNFDNDWVSAMLIQSKLWYNSSFKKERNYIISLALLSLLSSWLLFTKSMVQDKKVHQKIQTHKNKLAQNHSMRWIDNDANIYNQAWELMKEFITLYGKWWLSEDEIQDDIYKFLSESSSWPEWINKFIASPSDKFIQGQFLYNFVNNSFYEKMFKNGFETLDPIPLLKWLKSEFIETLTYDWPISEWYNESTNTFFMIHNQVSLNTNAIKWLEDEDLVSWYILEHKWHISIIKVPEVWYRQMTNNMFDVIVLSESEPDANWDIVIKRFILDDYDSNDVINTIKKEWKKIIFVNTHQKTKGDIHSNLIINKETIVNFFSKNSSTYAKSCEVLEKIAWFHPHFVGSDRYYSEVNKLKRQLLIELYEKWPLWNNWLTRIWYDYNEQMIMEFVWVFVHKHKNKIDEIKANR